MVIENDESNLDVFDSQIFSNIHFFEFATWTSRYQLEGGAFVIFAPSSIVKINKSIHYTRQQNEVSKYIIIDECQKEIGIITD